MRGLIWLLVLLSAPAALAESARRFAVVVGANSGALGRPALRYAHADAKEVAAVLIQAGRFRAEDVQVLLDPRPKELLDTLDTALALAAAEAKGAMVLFYYSGHADEHTLYPSGRKLELGDIKTRLDGSGATVRVGILDACRGGGWTGAKGLRSVEPFEVSTPLVFENEGSVLIASSSGIEDANEAAALGGSIFTHHLVAAMRGGADLNGDGSVTVSELFDYTRERTVRDSAVLTAAPQHPSFQINLKGREELPLTFVDRARSVVQVRQQLGPIQILDVSLGRHVLELPAGARTTTVALRPGRYVALRQDRMRRFARAFELQEGERLELDESALSPAENLAVASKGLHTHPWNTITLEPVPLIAMRLTVAYERVLTPYFSARAEGAFRPSGRNLLFNVVSPFGAALDLGGRYYFFGRAPEAFYFGSALGLHYDAPSEGSAGPTTRVKGTLEFGNTWLVAKRFVFTLGLGMNVDVPLSEEAARLLGGSDYLFGPHVRVGLGAAF